MARQNYLLYSSVSAVRWYFQNLEGQNGGQVGKNNIE